KGHVCDRRCRRRSAGTGTGRDIGQEAVTDGERSLLLEADQITFEYTPGTPVLDTWSAQFFAGTMTALTGRSGRGKSTLLYLLGLMLKPTSGDIIVDGEATARL